MGIGVATDVRRARRRDALRLTVAALLVSFAGLIAVTAQFVVQAESMVQAQTRQIELALQLRRLQAVMLAVVDAETGQRGYLLTGNDRYLDPYRKAIDRLPALLTALDIPPDGEPGLAERAAVARQTIAAKLAELADTIRLHMDGHHEQAMERVRSGEGQVDMEQLRAQIDVVIESVRAQRDRLVHDITRGVERERGLLVIAVSSLFVFTMLALAQVVSTLRARGRFEQALADSQAFLHRTGRLAGIGGWEVDLATGRTVWSEEVCRILEAPPDASPTLEEALASYPPEARAAMESAHAACIATGKPWDLELPRITRSGRRIWVRSVGSLETEHGRPRRIVGAMQDVTDRKLLEQRLADRERALRDLNQVVEHAPDFVVQTDSKWRVLYMNPALRAALGLAASTPLEGRSFAEFNTAQTNERFDAEIIPATMARGAWLGESTLQLAAGRVVPISLMAIAHRDGQGDVERFSAVMRNIEREVAAREELRRQTATLASVTEAIPAMVCVVGRDGLLRFANSAFEAWAGRSRADMLGRPATDVLDAVEAEARRPWTERVLAGEMVNFETPSAGWRGARHVHVSYIPLWRDGAVDGYVAIAHDITRHKEEAERLLELSERDALTGLLNRTGFEAWLARASEAGHADAIALLYVDLDHFKPVNDNFGHAAGDEVLRAFARRLRELVRPTDAIARIGGDEFAIALAGVRDRARADTIAEAIVAAANLPFQVGALDVAIGASVGVALQLEPGADWQRLAAHADEMLYKAKERGRGTYA
jgi:diguanylate cyclase (GGDEF)-like protein/PAS domain S-box-containing protein